MNRFRIGTRSSTLALWQTNLVVDKLNALGYTTELVSISSTGDEILDKPLHKIDSVGLFTGFLNRAMLEGKIDLAVHSLKDVPTKLPEGIIQVAVLERSSYQDVLIYNDNPLQLNTAVIATGSVRRKAQWLYYYPEHTFVDLRGNVNTRLEKLSQSDWNGAIFAIVGLQRIGILPKNHVILDWMIPSPAQGVIVITALSDNLLAKEACRNINHQNTEIITTIERDFMKTLEGGCTAPIGALAQIRGNILHFEGVLTALDGKKQLFVKKNTALKDIQDLGKKYAEELLQKGGSDLMRQIKRQL